MLFISDLILPSTPKIFSIRCTRSSEIAFPLIPPSLDAYHDPTTLICVYIQDLINKYYPPPSTNQSVSYPFFSSRERAALLKRVWSAAIERLIDRVHPALTQLTIIISPLFSTSVSLAADTARTTARLLHSADAALTALHNLEQILKTGPWRNTHIITAEQWTAQEKQMRRWKLQAADEAMRLKGYTWEADTEGKEYSWFFGGARTVMMAMKEKREW